MSYQICVFDPAYAGSREAASDAWNNETYYNASQPDGDQGAAKWRVTDALMAFDEALFLKPLEKPRTGLLALLFRKPVPVHRCLYVAASVAGAEGVSFRVFDDVVEVDLPWYAEGDEVEAHVRNLWRYLEHFSRAGWTTIYDTERNELLNLATDFDLVLARYVKNLGPAEDESDVEPAAATTSPQATAAAGTKPDKPFTGNVG